MSEASTQRGYSEKILRQATQEEDEEKEEKDDEAGRAHTCKTTKTCNISNYRGESNICARGSSFTGGASRCRFKGHVRRTR